MAESPKKPSGAGEHGLRCPPMMEYAGPLAIGVMIGLFGQTGAVLQAIEIGDAGDPRLADYTQLTDISLRTSLEAEHGLFIAEGSKVIARAVRAGYPVRSMLLARSRRADLAAISGQGTPGDRDVPVYVVP